MKGFTLGRRGQGGAEDARLGAGGGVGVGGRAGAGGRGEP